MFALALNNICMHSHEVDSHRFENKLTLRDNAQWFSSPKTAKEKNEINSKLSDPDTWKHGKCNSYWWVEISNALFQPAASYCVVLKLYCETLGCWNFYILLIFRPRKRDENIWIIRHLINTVKLNSMSHRKSSLLDNVSEREAILVLFGFSEVNNTWLQRPSNSLITCARIDCIFLSIYWRNRPRRMLREQEKRFPNYSAPAHELQKRRIENAVVAFIKWILTKYFMFQFFMGLPFLLIRAL